MPTDREMPKYRCHKVVHALKIHTIIPGQLPTWSGVVCRGSFKFGSACGNCPRCEWERATGGKLASLIVPLEKGYAEFNAPEGWMERFKGSEEDFGYYVVYDDGYASWSPTKAFEEGYTKL